MPSLLKSRKAQFFVLSAFAIIVVIFSLSQWIEPYTIIDTSSIVMREDFFIFNNIKEKANETVMISKNCEDLLYSLEEYKFFVEKFASAKALNLTINYITNCNPNWASVSFDITLRSPSSNIRSSFTTNKLFQ